MLKSICWFETFLTPPQSQKKDANICKDALEKEKEKS